MSLTSGYNDAPYGIKELGSVFLTEMAREIQQIQADPLGFLMPQRVIQEKTIKVEWTEGNLRVLGVVKPRMPNALNTFSAARSFMAEAAYFRRGQFIDQDTINYLRAPGSQTKTYGMDLVQEQLQEMIEQANMMMSVLRAQMLLGGINYTDPETGVNISADSGIPADHFITLGTTAGYTGSITWDDIDNSDPITDLQRLVFQAELKGRNRPTHMLCNGALLFVLGLNKKVRSFLPGNTYTALYQTGLVKFDNSGDISEIAGLKVVKVNTVYDDIDANGDLVRRYMFPVNKIVLCAQNHPSLPGQVLGRTYLTRGEHPRGHEGETGVWVRTFSDQQLGGPQTAPGVGMQVGMAGLPVLHKPWWVHVITVATEANITAKTGNTYVL